MRPKMIQEPSLLLIDDWAPHYDHVLAMNLKNEKEPWVVEGAIDKTIDGAFDRAYKLIEKYVGFTVIVLDIAWFHCGEEYGGIKVLLKLQDAFHEKHPIARQVLIVTRKASLANPDPELQKLIAKLRILPDMQRLFYLETKNGRDALKMCLLSFWKQVRPK